MKPQLWDPQDPQSVWKLQHLFCFLSYVFKEFSCFFEEKALGPMPPHRKSILGFVRSFSNMSALLVLASLKLKEAALELQSSPVPWTWKLFGSIPPDDIITLCEASCCDLFQVGAYIKPIFSNLQEEITVQSSKSKHLMRKSQMDADFETMAKILSYVECLLCELLEKLRPLLGGRFETDMHILMKLGKEIHLREKIEPQPDPIFFESWKQICTVLPFKFPFEAVARLWQDYTAGLPFRYLYYGAMGTRRYTSTSTQKPRPSNLNNPELRSLNLSHPERMGQILLSSKASPMIKDEEIWIGHQRTWTYNQFLEETTLRDVIFVTFAQKRIKKLLVSLHPSCMLLFRERGHALILQQEIPLTDILLVTHDFDFPAVSKQEVGVCWKSSLTEPVSIVYLKLIFDDATKARVWASCLAPKDVPYELIAEPPRKVSVPPVSQLLNSKERSHGTSTADSRGPAPKTLPEDKNMKQAQRLLSRINNQDLHLLDYRIVCLPGGFKAVIIQDRHTAVSHAAIDILVDETPSFLEAEKSSSEDVEKILGSSSNDHPVESSMKGFHLGEYLKTCGGTWTLSEEPSHKSCYIEVPTELATTPSPTTAHNFHVAFDSPMLEFMRSYPPIWLAQFSQRGYTPFYSMKLMVYSREPLEELEEWVRESLAKAAKLGQI
ncbi:hypothetical protein V8E51_013565 [Hyaloscypha variabilis]